ncbi:hypothetical protein SEA_PHARAOH_30 [Mycobacterium phage Pharaoh]|uniref:Minor tail protein n=1 Tax=Mycobacterium phage Pharaoh TaxID=2530140 RepID=A0A481W381_9CAUD|nr:minor tail protein [Mycobacterium phage Pharaoh]QBJ00219.1 hypothetical protein SEA_PHARAOH_30 [Mycobacterium phage Pharaoh]
MNPVYQPTNWFDLAPYILLSLPAILTAWLGVKNVKTTRQQHRENKQHISELKYEITNDHSSNIRHDMDLIRDLVRDGFHQITGEVEGLRRDIRTERRERIEADRLLRLVKGDLIKEEEFDL